MEFKKLRYLIYIVSMLTFFLGATFVQTEAIASSNISTSSSSSIYSSAPVSSTQKETDTSGKSISAAATGVSAVPVYRLYNNANKEHLYTEQTSEMNALLSIYNSDWRYEGAVWMAPTSGVPVYRVYNPHSGEHVYTKDTNEVRVLTSQAGWVKDNGGNPVFYGASSGNPIYRLFNSAAGVGAHFETSSLTEKNNLVSKGWHDEGIAWYGESTPVVSNYVPPITPRPHAQQAPIYFSQLDPRWSGVPLGTSTVGPSGCVATSLAMVLKGCYGENVDPGTVALRADSLLGGRSIGFGLSGGQMRTISNSYGHSVTEISSEAQASDFLLKGYPVIFFVNVGIGHAVVAWGYDINTGNVQVLDPYARKFFPSGVTTLNHLWGMPSADPGDWDIGRPVFVIN